MASSVSPATHLTGAFNKTHLFTDPKQVVIANKINQTLMQTCTLAKPIGEKGKDFKAGQT